MINAVGNWNGYKSILILILTTLMSASAFAKAKAPASTAVCVANYTSIAPQTPEEAAMKSFETQFMAGQPMIPSAWTSEAGTSVKIYADDKGVIWLDVLNLPFEKFAGRPMVIDKMLKASESSLRAALALISQNGSKRMISFCQDNGVLYLNPGNSADKITLTPGPDGTITISFTKAIYIFNDTVKQVLDN